eukprot:COSAG01_NODE_6153_length_3821_cov_2.098603_5_plen_50_part_00
MTAAKARSRAAAAAAAACEACEEGEGVIGCDDVSGLDRAMDALASAQTS